MNTNQKAANIVKNNVSSFVTAPVENIKNVAMNTATSLKNTAMNVKNSVSNVFNDITKPINESINSAIETNESPFISISVIITLGVLIVLFIIIVIFREQIVIGLENLWIKIKELFGVSKPAVQPPPQSYEQVVIDKSAVEKILPGMKEVFNIADNKYKYSDAEPLCKAFGAELATYDQVKDAWNKGADWCNYGWVKGQAAVYPTQESTFNKLQAGPEDQRMSCGVTGINGGYFDNPDLRFGVNCYGNKPSENETDTRNQMARENNITPEGIKYDKKVLDYKANLNQIAVNPFKAGTWSS
jgi:hypothetical protein